MAWGFECLSLLRPSPRAMQSLLNSTPRWPVDLAVAFNPCRIVPGMSTARACACTCCSGSFNHPHAAATEHAPPLPSGPVDDGWVLDHNRVQVGAGRQHFDKARNMLKAWKHMDLGWVQTNRPPVRVGEKVCIAARSLFVWNHLPLEVVYTRNERTQLPRQPQLGRFPVNRKLTSADMAESEHGSSGPAERFLYATSTTGGHQLVGEERFSVEWHQKDSSVWYEIFTISKPATPLARLMYPLVRFHQKHFARQSLRKMVLAVSES